MAVSWPETEPSARDAFTKADHPPAARRAIPAAGRQTVQRVQQPSHAPSLPTKGDPTHTRSTGSSHHHRRGRSHHSPVVTCIRSPPRMPDRRDACPPRWSARGKHARSPDHAWYAARPDCDPARNGFVTLQCGVFLPHAEEEQGVWGCPLTRGRRGTTASRVPAAHHGKGDPASAVSWAGSPPRVLHRCTG
jgi:hypothetical protein